MRVGLYGVLLGLVLVIALAYAELSRPHFDHVFVMMFENTV